MGPVIPELVFLLFVSFCSFCHGKAVIEDPALYEGHEYTFDFNKNEHKHRPLFNELTTETRTVLAFPGNKALIANPSVRPSSYSQKYSETLNYGTKLTSEQKAVSQGEKIKPNCDSEKFECHASGYESSDTYIKVVEKSRLDKSSSGALKDFDKKADSSYIESSKRPVSSKTSTELNKIGSIVFKNDLETEELKKAYKNSVDDVVIIKSLLTTKKEKQKKPDAIKQDTPEKEFYSERDSEEPVDFIYVEKVNQEADYCGSEDCEDAEIKSEDDVVIKPVLAIKKEKPKNPDLTEQDSSEKESYSESDNAKPVVIKKVNQEADYCGSEDCEDAEINSEDDVEIIKPVLTIKKEKTKIPDLTEQDSSVKEFYSESDNAKPVVIKKVNQEATYCESEDCEDVVIIKPIPVIKDMHKTLDATKQDPSGKEFYSESDYEKPVYFDIVNVGKSKAIQTSENKEEESKLKDPEPIYPTGRFQKGNMDDIQSRTRIPFQNSNLWSLIFNPGAKGHKLKQCVTRTNESGLCMYINQCPVPNVSSSMEQLLNNACVMDDVFIGVCCPEFPVETVKVEWEDSGNIVQKRVEEEFDDEIDCGIRPTAPTNQMWPWKAQLVSMSDGRIFCGGVVIGREFILTAAHCTTKIPRNQILVRLGQHSTSPGDDFVVTEIKRHAQYNSRNLHNDIALLKLGHKIKPSNEVSVVCLPVDDDDSRGKAVLLGWRGKLGENELTEELEILPNSVCQDRMHANVPQSMLCTESRSEDAVSCNADSGAPLVVEDANQYRVIGILSWNRNDCDKRFPSVFSRVSSFVKWIRRHAT